MPQQIDHEWPDPEQPFNLLNLLFERMPMGVAVLDRRFRIRRYNPTWGDFATRYAPPSGVPLAPGVNYFDHLPGTESVVRPLFERALSGETVQAMGCAWNQAGLRPGGMSSLVHSSKTAKPSVS